MRKLVFGEFIKTFGAAYIQRRLFVRDVRDRRQKIIGGRERRVTPVGIDQRPVLEVHVGIAYQGVEGEPANKFGNVVVSSFRGDDVGDAACVALFVFVIGIDTEDLGEVLDMDGSAVREPVKALYGEGLSFQRTDPVGQVPDGIDVNELKRRHVHADQSGERHHRVFVFGHTREFPRGQLDDPGSADAAGRNGQPAPCRLDGGKLQLHAGQRKT